MQEELAILPPVSDSFCDETRSEAGTAENIHDGNGIESVVPLRRPITEKDQLELDTWWMATHGLQNALDQLMNPSMQLGTPESIMLEMNKIWEERILEYFQTCISHTGDDNVPLNFKTAQDQAKLLVERYTSSKEGEHAHDFKNVDVDKRTICLILHRSKEMYNKVKEIVGDDWTNPIKVYCRKCMLHFQHIVIVHCMAGCYIKGSHDLVSNGSQHDNVICLAPKDAYGDALRKNLCEDICKKLRRKQTELNTILKQADKGFGTYMQKHVSTYVHQLSSLFFHMEYFYL